ncbi:transmembrane protein 104 homolog isoform X2 [Dysidea avara]|uniref:transmembrane protein 104 homolog isoform X2 n=1 Tax=Dysidea avara TaxID=196820 RepID=UPI003333FF78
MNRVTTWISGSKKDRTDQTKEPKSVGLISGFFFNINYIVGTGFLSVPYAFYRAGALTASITLLVLSFISWNSANWIVETMSRSQAIIDWQESIKKQDGSASIKSNGNSTDSAIRKKPKFHLLLTRKFEQSEMSEIFFGRYMKYAYLVVFCLYMFSGTWAGCTVAGSAWASNLPLNFGSLSQCDEEEFHNNLIPSGGCLGAYRFCIMLFALIVIPLSLVELTEQKFLQVLLGLMRFFTFGCLIIYSVVNLVSQPQYNPYNTTTTFNSSYHSYGHQILKFDFTRWVLVIPIFVYAQILHQGIPSMTQPIKAKEWMKVFFGAVFISTTVLYLSLGVTMSLWFKSSIQETATLNFVEIAHHSSSTALRVMAYYIVFFPSLDVCSAYPLALQLRSQYVCHKTFGTALVPTHRLPVNEELPLLISSRKVKSSGLGWKEDTYYTPYSTVFSHPIIVVVFAIITLISCGLVITSLTVSQ